MSIAQPTALWQCIEPCPLPSPLHCGSGWKDCTAHCPWQSGSVLKDIQGPLPLVGSGNPPIHCRIVGGKGQWAVELLQHTGTLHGALGHENPSIHCHTARGRGQWAPAVQDPTPQCLVVWWWIHCPLLCGSVLRGSTAHHPHSCRVQQEATAHCTPPVWQCTPGCHLWRSQCPGLRAAPTVPQKCGCEGPMCGHQSHSSKPEKDHRAHGPSKSYGSTSRRRGRGSPGPPMTDSKRAHRSAQGRPHTATSPATGFTA